MSYHQFIYTDRYTKGTLFPSQTENKYYFTFYINNKLIKDDRSIGLTDTVKDA